jgi:Tol biopolymer transport system component
MVWLGRGTSRRLPLPEGPKRPPGWELSRSRDGRHFAFATAVDWASSVSDLWIFRPVGLSAFPLMPDGGYLEWSPQWGPEGQLYFVSNRGGAMDLWRQRLDENAAPLGSPERLTTGVDMRYALFSPDHSQLAYARRAPRHNVWHVPILGDRPATWSDAGQLTFEQAEIFNLILSPDGGTLAFTLSRHGQRHVWLLPSQGGEMTRLLADPAAQIMPRWSPNGLEIAFHSEQEGGSNIRPAPVAGGPARNPTEALQKGEPADFLAPVWSPRGDEIHFLSRRGKTWEVWGVSRMGDRHRRLTEQPARGMWMMTSFLFSPSPWSPDGREIVFVSERSGSPDLWIVSGEGGEPRRLTDHPARDWGPNWSPDGRWILFSSERDEETRLWKVRPSGGEPEPVADVGVDPDGVRWSPDGASILFPAQRQGLWNFYAVPADGGAERQLTDLRGRYGRPKDIQTDGRHLYFTWNESSGEIWVMDLVR